MLQPEINYMACDVDGSHETETLIAVEPKAYFRKAKARPYDLSDVSVDDKHDDLPAGVFASVKLQSESYIAKEHKATSIRPNL